MDIFPGFLGIGVGIGFSAMAIQVAAFTGVEESVSGLAGGMIETTREVGGALDVVATMAITRADDILASLGPANPQAQALALTEGFQRACIVAAVISVLAALAAGLVLPRAERTPEVIVRAGADATDVTATPAWQES